MNLQDKLKEIAERGYGEEIHCRCGVDVPILLRVIETMSEALEFECDNRCADQNPCNAKDALEQAAKVLKGDV